MLFKQPLMQSGDIMRKECRLFVWTNPSVVPPCWPEWTLGAGRGTWWQGDSRHWEALGLFLQRLGQLSQNPSLQCLAFSLACLVEV